MTATAGSAAPDQPPSAAAGQPAARPADAPPPADAPLTGALVALGVPTRQALTAVLVYRAVTFWLAIAVGWLIYWRLRRSHPRPAGPGPRGNTAPG
jgi:hypothetical protein